MARLETSTNLVGKSIVLLDGTKAKIVDAIASGYKTDKSSKRIATRCVVKKGSGFAEIERMDLRLLEDTGEGYVVVKSSADKPAKTTAKASAKASAKPAANTSAKSKAAEKKPATNKKAERTSKRTPKAEAEVAETRSRVRRKPKAVEGVTLTEVTQEFTESLAERLYEHLRDSDLLKFDADNVTPITNAVDVKYSAEFAKPNMIHVTLGFEYALPEPEVESDAASAIDDAVIARASKKVGKTVGKKLAAAVKKAFGLTADDFQPGIVFNLNGADFVYCGPSKDDTDVAYFYGVETDKFRPVTIANLTKYEMVAEEVEEPDEDEEEEDEEDEDDTDFDDSDDSESDADEYTYVSVTKEHLADVNKNVTAKYHAKMAEMWGLDADVLVPGLVLTDGETTFAYVGFNNKGGLVVIDVADGDLMIYKKADVDTLTEFAAVVGDDEKAEDADDAEESDEEEEEEEEDGDDDFDFDDEPSDDFSDLTQDELIDKVVELGLTTPRKAANMKESKLRELLAS